MRERKRGYGLRFSCLKKYFNDVSVRVDMVKTQDLRARFLQYSMGPRHVVKFLSGSFIILFGGLLGAVAVRSKYGVRYRR